MLPYYTESFGNPFSVYSYEQENKEVIQDARKRVAGDIGARPDEIIFSGGTEADNTSLNGVAWGGKAKGNHIITLLLSTTIAFAPMA
jgi:cysteine desulfurase